VRFATLPCIQRSTAAAHDCDMCCPNGLRLPLPAAKRHLLTVLTDLPLFLPARS
jgi:hypothetical protein